MVTQFAHRQRQPKEIDDGSDERCEKRDYGAEPEEIDAVSGGMLAHLGVVAGVTLLAFGILAVKYASSSTDYGSGTCNSDGTYTE